MATFLYISLLHRKKVHILKLLTKKTITRMFSAAQFETNKEKKMVIFAIVIVMQSGIDI